MDNTGTLDLANRYSNILKVSIQTTKLNGLRRISLLQFLDDLLGGKLGKYVTSKDKKTWKKFLDCCFPELDFCYTPSMAGYIYVGSANEFPTDEVITNNSVAYPQTEKTVFSPKTTGKYFWIAVPYGVTIKSIWNTFLAGDYLPVEKLDRTNAVVRNQQCNVFYAKARIPFYDTFKIVFK